MSIAVFIDQGGSIIMEAHHHAAIFTNSVSWQVQDNMIYFILLALAAEILGTVGGFGSSLFFVPVASYFFDFHAVLGITALFHIASNLAKIGLFRHGFDGKLVAGFGVPAVLFVILGAWLSNAVDVRMLELSLAVFLILLSLAYLTVKDLHLKPTWYSAAGGGALSGFAAGLVGTGGAIRGIALASYNLKIEVFIATSAIIDLGIDLSRSVVYTMNGYVHKEHLVLIPILLGVSFLGTFVGKRILSYFSDTQFKSVVLILVLVTGITTLLRVIAQF